VRTSVAHKRWSVETTTWPAVRLPGLADEALARLAARGNTRAFAAVYERYHQMLYRYCRSILKDDVDAQDALQSTFTRALSALQRGQRSAPLRPWLFRIAHNEAISMLRRRRRAVEPLGDPRLPSAASAEDQAGDRARLAVLLGDLAALPDRARSALVMRELSGLSHEEIAVALDISVGAAKQSIFEARRGIAECAEGRAMACAEVCQAISDGDRRVLRGRRVRAHLRDCTSCSSFAAAIGARQTELRAVVPALPAAASAVVLARAMESALGGGATGGALGSGGAATGGAAAASTAGKTAGIAIASKGFATASVLATAAVTVGGVAAVVRIDGAHRAAKSPRPQMSQPSHAAATRTTAAHGAAHSSGSTALSGTSTAPGRQVSRVYPHKQGSAAGRHTSVASGTGAWGRGARDRGLSRWQARGDGGASQGHGDGGAWQGRGDRGAHGHGAVPALRHDTFEGYAGERGHDANAARGGGGRGDSGSRGHGHDSSIGQASHAGRALGHSK
jgi:RNA polymerase sigma factor (sigma-70 family)